jgi:hypothetical protein
VLDAAAAALTLLSPLPDEAAKVLKAVRALKKDGRWRRNVARAMSAVLDNGPGQRLSVRPDPIGDHHLVAPLSADPKLLTRLVPRRPIDDGSTGGYGVLRHADFCGADIPALMEDARLWLASVVPFRDDVGVLAGVLDACPPVVVQAGTLRVIDGHMRIAAAEHLGRTSVPVQWVQGDDAELMELAATTNCRHGLPLTASQRKATAQHLLVVAPGWSNRRIARACGISEANVRRSRRPPASPTPLDTRVGLDGKAYPMSKVAHQAARDLLASCPRPSDRAIARATGLSPTTVGCLRRDARTEPPRSRSHWLRPWRAALRWLLSILGLSGASDHRGTSPANPAARPSQRRAKTDPLMPWRQV